MKRLVYLLLLSFVVVFTSQSYAQSKIGFVDSQKILAEFQESKDVQNQLEVIKNQYQAEYEQKVRDYQVLIEEIESQSLLLSEEKKKEKMRQAQEKAQEIDKYKYDKLGPEGEFYKKNLELTRPLIDKINAVIHKIGTDEEYDFILDAANGNIVHALPKYNLTDQVLEELSKGASAPQGN